MDRLPEELILQILESLDSPSPSFNFRGVPTRKLTVSRTRPVKACSLVCKRWRRLAIPTLFKYARLRLSPDSTSGQSLSCSICDPDRIWSDIPDVAAPVLRELDESTPGGTQQRALELAPAMKTYHAELVRGATVAAALVKQVERPCDSEKQLRFESILRWHAIIYHSLDQFLDFLNRWKLEAGVNSFILLSDRMLPHDLEKYPKAAESDLEWRYVAMAAFWRQLLSVINPERVAILAKPMVLACATNSKVNTSKAWAYHNRDYRLLELRQIPNCAHSSPGLDVNYKPFSITPLSNAGIAESSLLQMRPWTDVCLNEGSFHSIYNGYRFFERDPPSLLTQFQGFIKPEGSTSNSKPSGLSSIQSFTYCSVLPYVLVLDSLLSCITTLDLQIAPLPGSDLLDDSGSATRAECLSGIIHFYRNLVATAISPYRMSRGECPKLRRFICRDVHFAALQPKLDDVFVELCMPVWAEVEPGIFVRLAESVDAGMRGEVWEQD